MTHRFPIRVYYEDTDAAGIVYYANYLKFAERARTEWLRALGVDQSKLLAETGVGFVVRKVEADYLAPARLDDLLTVTSTVSDMRKVGLSMDQAIMRGETLIAAVKVDLACIGPSGKPVALPEGVRLGFTK